MTALAPVKLLDVNDLLRLIFDDGSFGGKIARCVIHFNKVFRLLSGQSRHLAGNKNNRCVCIAQYFRDIGWLECIGEQPQ
ncbi:hypothetical protein ASE04_14450 [Rhizobium sp. Root708]|nr:hypothetical protein ASE04_14450 [Rhizobium sp. Root708]